MVRLVQTCRILLCCIVVHANENDCQYHCYLYSILSSDFSQSRVSFFNLENFQIFGKFSENSDILYRNFSKKYIAVVPLVQYVTGFCVSFTMKPLSKHLGKVSNPGPHRLRVKISEIYGLKCQIFSIFQIFMFCEYKMSENCLG